MKNKFQVGDLIQTEVKVPLLVVGIREKPLITLTTTTRSNLLYIITKDGEEFLEIYTDWADENMELCE